MTFRNPLDASDFGGINRELRELADRTPQVVRNASGSVTGFVSNTGQALPLGGGGGGVTQADLNALGYAKNVAGGVVGLNAQNQAVANIIPRTGTLASLLALAGGTGEIASATDNPSLVVQFPPAAGGTQRIGPMRFEYGLFDTVIMPVTTPTPIPRMGGLDNISPNPRALLVFAKFQVTSPAYVTETFAIVTPSYANDRGDHQIFGIGGSPTGFAGSQIAADLVMTDGGTHNLTVMFDFPPNASPTYTLSGNVTGAWAYIVVIGVY